MAKTVRVGFVGAGFVAQNIHIPIYDALDNIVLSAVCDNDPFILDFVSQRYGIPNIFTDHRDLLNSNVVDAVVVTLPRRQAFSVVRDCLLASKWVFTEKPLCLDPENGRSLHEICNRMSVGVQVGYMKRYDSATSLAKKLYNETFDMNKLISIDMKCLMGNSYANTTTCVRSNKRHDAFNGLEEYPTSINKTHHWSYEQYINVFSHTTHLLEYITGRELQLSKPYISELGEGVVIFLLGDTPVTFHTSRGVQQEWLETIKFIFNNSTLSLSLPPAFLRNVPGEVVMSGSCEGIQISRTKPSWSWSFSTQAEAFVTRILKGFNKEENDREINSAVRQVEFIKDIYDKSFGLSQ